MSTTFRLKRDGVDILLGTELECWQWLHRHHSYSVDHALNHEGYSIEEVPDENSREDYREA